MPLDQNIIRKLKQGRLRPQGGGTAYTPGIGGGAGQGGTGTVGSAPVGGNDVESSGGPIANPNVGTNMGGRGIIGPAGGLTRGNPMTTSINEGVGNGPAGNPQRGGPDMPAPAPRGAGRPGFTGGGLDHSNQFPVRPMPMPMPQPAPGSGRDGVYDLMPMLQPATGKNPNADALLKRMGYGKPGGIGMGGIGNPGQAFGPQEPRREGPGTPNLNGFPEEAPSQGLPEQGGQGQAPNQQMPPWMRARLRRNPGGGGQLGNPNMQFAGSTGLQGGWGPNGQFNSADEAYAAYQAGGGTAPQHSIFQGNQQQFNPQAVLAQMQGQYGNFGGGPQYQL